MNKTLMKLFITTLLISTYCCKKNKRIIENQPIMDKWFFKSEYIRSTNDLKKFRMNLEKDSIFKDGICFYNFFSENYKDKKMYLGQKNDTVFCFYLDYNFYDVFLILDLNKKRYLSTLGNDYSCTIDSISKVDNNKKVYHFNYEIINKDYDDVNDLSTYPILIFKKISFSKENGFERVTLLDRYTNVEYEALINQ